MNKTILWTAFIAAGLGASSGYWLASKPINNLSTVKQAEKKPLFYRHPMNQVVTSPVPAKDEMGMDYVPVYEESAPNTETASVSQSGTATPPTYKILYYRNPMGLSDTSPVPKKDSMGMDYIPVYEEEENQNEAQILRVSTEKIQRLGVKTALVKNTEIAHTVRSVGSIEIDERRVYNVTLRFDGFIEKLYVNTTGQSVVRNQPLFELYSPELVSAQQEYLTARSGQVALGKSEDWLQSGMKSLTESSLERLRNWGISRAELERLEQQGKVQHAVSVRSPASGIVLEKLAVAGSRVMAGDTLFKIADLSRVWIIADVYEQDLGLIKLGQTVLAKLDTYPDRTFKGRVGFVYPTLTLATHTAKVRIELPNPSGLLKPMMYARLEIATQAHTALAVPRSAVLENDRRTRVLVDRGGGRFESRPVRLGLRGEEMTEILEGLREQERVVVSANFLIDAESNLKAALGGFESADTNTHSTTPAESPSQPVGEQNHQGGKQDARTNH